MSEQQLTLGFVALGPPLVIEVGPALARRTDPITSHQAAHHVEASGKANSQRQRCIRDVRQHPGATAGEIASRVNIDRHTASKRLPELVTAGLLRRGSPRRCQCHGTNMTTWWPA